MMTTPVIVVLANLMASGNSMPALPTADQVVARMMAHDGERLETLHEFTAMRRYVLENRSHHKRAEMLFG